MAIDELGTIINRFGRSVSEQTSVMLLRSIINTMTELLVEEHLSDYDILVIEGKYRNTLVVMAVEGGSVFSEIFTINKIIRFKKIGDKKR